MKRFFFFSLWLALPALFAGAGAAAERVAGLSEEEIGNAIIRVEVTLQRGDWYSPWQQTRSSRAVGSGFIISPGMVMTNAHIVSDAKQITVRRNGISTPFFAKVHFIAHDSDLALLKVADESFDKGIEPLPLGELPSLRTRVRTYGFPGGGEKISRTEGVISRIQFVTYLHSGADAHLAIQTDSAINPGNSGGPVMQEGKVVGVAFQTNTRLNDVGFFIPTSVIRRFLKDIEDGSYDGYAEMGIVASNLINRGYRRYLKLPESMPGVLVDRVMPGTSADGFILPGDVITAIDGIPVALDGTINYHGFMLDFQQIPEEKQVGEEIEISVRRGGKSREIRFKLIEFKDGARLRSNFDSPPQYVIFAGLVFMKLDQEYLNSFGNYWENAKKSLLYSHFFQRTEFPEMVEKEAVLLTRVLPHQINSSYRNRANSIVSEINGMPITRLSDISKAFSAISGDYHRVILEQSGVVMVLPREEARTAHKEILATYGIIEDHRLP